MVNIGEKCNRLYGYPVEGNFGYGGSGSSSSSSSSSTNFFDGFRQSTAIFGGGSGSSSSSGFNSNSAFGYNNGFNNNYNTNLSGGFTFSNFEGVNTSALQNGVSWNNMNNPALYRFPQIDDNDMSAFAMPTRSSISYIDNALKPLPDVKVSEDSDFSAYSMYGGNRSISYIDNALKPLPNFNVSESSDFDSYSMFGGGSTISYIDELVRPINFNFNSGYNPFGSGYAQNYNNNYGFNNNFNGGFNNGYNNYNNQANKPAPYIPSNNGIYDQKSYQQYLDSVWGSNYASSIPSTTQTAQAGTQRSNQSTQSGQTSSQSGTSTDTTAPSEEAQNLNAGREKTNRENALARKVEADEATDYERELKEELDKRDESIKNDDELRELASKLYEALELDQEERAESLLNKCRREGKLDLIEEAFLIGQFNNKHITLREAIANSFTMKGLGWATKRYSPKVKKYLNMLDEEISFASPINTALALQQTLTDGVFGFRANQDRIRKILETLKEKDPEYIKQVDDIYKSQISGTDFAADLYAKWFVSNDIRNLASSIFDGTDETNQKAKKEN